MNTGLSQKSLLETTCSSDGFFRTPNNLNNDDFLAPLTLSGKYSNSIGQHDGGHAARWLIEFGGSILFETFLPHGKYRCGPPLGCLEFIIA